MPENNSPSANQQPTEKDANSEALLAGAQQIGLSLSPAQLHQFSQYCNLLLEWNQRINLTAITVPHEVYSKLFLDSLVCLLAIPNWPNREKLALLDVGSGAGFPGLPLQIAMPTWRVTLLETTGKKVRFLQEAITTLGLSQSQALQGRAEELAHDQQHRAAYDIVTARAVAALPTLLEYCLPFCRPGGLVIAPKKGAISDEIESGKRAAASLGGRLLAVHDYSLPGLEDQRVLVVCEASKKTPAQYPRRAGAPTKHPLG